MEKGLGIDLGTTYSRVAIWQYGQVEVLANDQGNRSTPSYVALSDGQWIMGDAAKNQVYHNPTNTVFDIKRLIGRRYEDLEIQEEMKLWPFQIVNVCGSIMIEVHNKGKMKLYTPEDISAVLLMKLKETAEARLGFSCRKAVITVPAHFNESQRERTRDAGLQAGLDVKKIINEPTATAFAYSFHNKGLQDAQNIFIFDLGGGTFDVSIVIIREGPCIEVKSTFGDTHLGGKDFDLRLVNYMIEELRRKYKKDISGNSRALNRLRLAAERAKRSLSSSTEAVIEIDALFNDVDVYMKVTRAKFEALCNDLYQRIMATVRNVLIDAKYEKDSIHDVVLVGGSTRMPKVRQLLQKFFSGLSLNLSLDAEEAVVSGAAIQAAILCGEEHESIKDLLLVEITPLSLGIETAGGLMTVLISRGSKIPCQRTRIFTTLMDHQSAVTIQIFEGERSLTKDNHVLDTFTLYGIPSLPRGIPKIEVTFSLDVDGILHVEGKETSSGISQQIKVKKKSCKRLMHSEISKMVSEAKKYKDEDEKLRQHIEARNKLEKFVYQVKQAVIECEKRLNSHDVIRVNFECKKCLIWLHKNADAPLEAYKEKYNYLVALCKQCSSRDSSSDGVSTDGGS